MENKPLFDSMLSNLCIAKHGYLQFGNPSCLIICLVQKVNDKLVRVHILRAVNGHQYNARLFRDTIDQSRQINECMFVAVQMGMG